MQWINNYSLFLFDFDGVLADTEQLHYRAYIEMCKRRGFALNWNFERYSKAAHYSSTGLRDQIYAQFPDLQEAEPKWQVLYEEKKQIFLDLIQSQEVPLIEGVATLLTALENADITRCVVTHSPFSLIQIIRKQNPILNTIPHWITRENYSKAKPDPECYELAIKHYAKDNKVIGFEDSPRGLSALAQTKARPVLICPPDSPYLEETLQRYPHVSHFQHFNSIHNLP